MSFVPIEKVLCVFHSNCADGFGAAWAVRAALGGDNVEFYPGVYQEAPPDTKGRIVVFVDFCYKPEVMLALAEKAIGVLVLDHHKSAMEAMVSDGDKICALGTYKGEVTWDRILDNFYQDRCEGASYGRIYTLFDMQRSGAMIAWNFFHPEQIPPRLIQHIQDRDLWKFQLAATREIQAAVFSYPYDFEVWDDLMHEGNLQELIAGGAAIERKHHKDIAELVKVCMYWAQIGEHRVPVASLPYTLTSDAGDLMAKEFAPKLFAVCFWNTPKGRVFSLRSIEGGIDVSAVAASYGGGGHKHAAGFYVRKDHPLYSI